MKGHSMRLLACFLALLLSAGLAPAGDGHQPHEELKYQGSYYPGPYYSRAYIQDFPMEPGDRPLLFRLRPFRHYGRYDYGVPIEPELTNGTVESYRFPYRYCWNFRPTAYPTPIQYDACADPSIRRYDDLRGGPREVPAPNEPVELPVPFEARR